MNCISYSLFGYGEQNADSFDFKSYLRNFAVNLRMAPVLYPEWKVYLAVDEDTFYSPYKEYFVYHQEAGRIELKIESKQALCINMLYRLHPLFISPDGYDRVICRDTDSLLCYRERQAVAYWEKSGRIASVITDSISHTVPIMGGMCGFMSKEFREVTGWQSFADMMAVMRESGINFQRKGTDQEFLNRYVLPKVHTSITEHYIKGMPQSFRGDCHHEIQTVLKMPDYMKETDALGWHIGASGFQVDATLKFLVQHGIDNKHYDYIEKKFPNVFYWHL